MVLDAVVDRESYISKGDALMSSNRYFFGFSFGKRAFRTWCLAVVVFFKIAL